MKRNKQEPIPEYIANLIGELNTKKIYNKKTIFYFLNFSSSYWWCWNKIAKQRIEH